MYQAAIGSSLAAELYGAETLAEEIEDDPENYTRFFALARDPNPTSPPRPKTSLAFVVPHEPGSLHRALGIFAERGIDLTKLESRPIPGRPWEYRFFIDVRGTPEGTLRESMRELETLTREFHVLGSYSEFLEAG